MWQQSLAPWGGYSWIAGSDLHDACMICHCDWMRIVTVSQRPWVRFPAAPPFFQALFQPFQRSTDSNGQRLRSLIRPSLISPRTKLIGVPIIGLPAVITLKIPLNHMSLCIRYLDVIFHYSHKNKSFISLTNSQRKFKQYNKAWTTKASHTDLSLC